MRLEQYERRDESGQMKVIFEVWNENGDIVNRDKTIPPQEDDLRSALKEEYDIE